MILDDTFSGLDNETQDRIFTRLLGSRGLLRLSGTTVLLATHQLQRLSYADQIIVVGNGIIQEQGKFIELKRRGGHLSNLLHAHRVDHEENTEHVEKHFEPRKKLNTQQSHTVTEVIRPLGDLQVYKHYFAAVGWLNTAGFFFMIAAFAFFSRFPGKRPSIYITPSHIDQDRSLGKVLDDRGRKAWSFH
jgi:ATP-binding cassette, subfamily C (CFTR/MRP), member 1